VIPVRVAQFRVFPDHIECLEPPLCHGRDHVRDGVARFVRQGALPGPREFFVDFRVGHRLVTRIDVGEPSHVAGPLDIVLPPQRVDAAAPDAYISAKHGQIATGLHIVHTGRVLGNAHGVKD